MRIIIIKTTDRQVRFSADTSPILTVTTTRAKGKEAIGRTKKFYSQFIRST